MRATTPRKMPETPEAELPLLDRPELAPVQETGVNTRSAEVATGSTDKWASYKEADNADFDQQDMAIPRIKLVQSLSHCLSKLRPEYVEGAHAGDFLFTLDNDKIDGASGFLFIPCAYRREYTEWTPKRKPAVFHGTDDSITVSCTPNEKGEQLLANGNEVVMSGTWYGMASKDEGTTWEPVVIGLSKSQFKVSKKLASAIQMFRETDEGGKLRAFPMFWRALRWTSKPTSGQKGDWNLWDFSTEGKSIDLGGDKLLNECAAFRESVSSGVVHAKHEDEVE